MCYNLRGKNAIYENRKIVLQKIIGLTDKIARHFCFFIQVQTSYWSVGHWMRSLLEVRFFSFVSNGGMSVRVHSIFYLWSIRWQIKLEKLFET